MHQRAGKPSELFQDLKNPSQNAPLTRSPRGDDGDDGDGADSSAWVEDKKECRGMSSEARCRKRVIPWIVWVWSLRIGKTIRELCIGEA